MLLSDFFKRGREGTLLRSGEFQSRSAAAKSSVPHGEALGGDAQMGIGGRSSVGGGSDR